MKPAPFVYHRATAVDEAIALLEQYEGDAKLLSGGQSLIPIVNMRLARPAALIDLNGIPGLAGIDEVADGRIRFGALTRHRIVEHSELVRTKLPLLSHAMPYVGHVAIRSRGTFGGSIAHADAAAELPAMATMFDAEITVTGPNGDRTSNWSDFFVSYLETNIEMNELVTSVSFQVPPPGMTWAFREVARRHGDYALVGCGVMTLLDEDSTIAEARIVLMGVDAIPKRLLDAEARLVGLKPGLEAFREIAHDAAQALEPNGDIHATPEYRKVVSAKLVRDLLAVATGLAA